MCVAGGYGVNHLTHTSCFISVVCVCGGGGVPHPIVSFVNASLNSHQVAALVSCLFVFLQLMVPTFCLQVLEPHTSGPGSLGKPAEGAMSPWHQVGEEPRPVSDNQLSERADGAISSTNSALTGACLLRYGRGLC